MIFALAGNQNCGKTTLFNALTGSNQHVGNFPGVTVDQKMGDIRGEKNCSVVDLPGIYSLRPYTQEEIVTRDFILNQKPDGIINIVDATNIERNLYLTLQLLELGKPVVLLSFIGIMCHVGIDVGSNTTAPKILMERLGMSLNDAAFATSLYFIFRTIGCLTGSFILRVMNHRAFFTISIVMMALSMLGMAFGTSKIVLYTAIALVGYGNSNVFSLVYSQALLSVPERQNEVSGLMIMGLFGGTVFPLFMGFASDAAGQMGAVAVMAIGVIYLFTFIKNIKH